MMYFIWIAKLLFIAKLIFLFPGPLEDYKTAFRDQGVYPGLIFTCADAESQGA